MLKHVLYTIALLLISLGSWAITPFEDDLQINEEFAELEQLENFLEAHPEVDYSSLHAHHQNLVGDLELLSDTSAQVNIGEPMPLVGAFWWGCCLSFIGLALVYLITENDREQVKNALIGCIIGTLIWGLGGILGNNIF